MAQRTEPYAASAWELFIKSSRIVLDNLKIFAVLAIPTLIMAVWDAYQAIKHSTSSNSFSFWSSVNLDSSYHSNTAHMAAWLYAVVLVASFVGGLGVYVAAIDFSAGRKPTLAKVMRRLLNKGLGLIAVIIMAGLATIAGFVALIIPGIYLLGKLYLAPFVYLAEDVEPWEAMRRSWRITRGYLWLVYSILLLGIVFSLTNLIPWVGVIVAAVLTALFGVAPALRYQELKNNPAAKS